MERSWIYPQTMSLMIHSILKYVTSCSEVLSTLHRYVSLLILSTIKCEEDWYTLKFHIGWNLRPKVFIYNIPILNQMSL